MPILRTRLQTALRLERALRLVWQTALERYSVVGVFTSARRLGRDGKK